MNKLSYISFDKLDSVFSEEEVYKIAELLNKKHYLYLDNESFELEIGCNKEQIQVKICLKKIDNSVVYPIEIVCMYDEYNPRKKEDLIGVIIDYMDSYWSEYFSDERNLFVPINWTRYESDGIQFYLRGFIRNMALEMQADAFLKEYGYGEHDISPISFET